MSSVEGSGVAPDRAPDTRALGSAYVIETVIGRGSSGEVWRGRVRDTGEPIAAKVLDAALTREPEVVARFIRERALLTKVNHPNVVTVRDLVVEGDTLAIITDLVEGPSLRAVLDDSGTLRPSHAVELTEQILLGLEAVHEQGLVHRDLKPENVLVARAPDGEARARIVDFGIAQLAHGDSANARGEIVGSAEYIAPELLEGGAATPAADLYAVGIVLYELLCGRTPFGSESVVTVIRRQLNEPAGRPAGMPMELWAVLQRLLAKNPERRPQTATEARALLTGVAASLRTVAPLPVADEDDPVVVEGDETIITPRRRKDEPAPRVVAPKTAPKKRHRWLVAGAVFVVVALVAAAIVVVGGSDTAHAASIQSAPEFRTDPGAPIVHRTLTIDGDAIAVNVVIDKFPAAGMQLQEFVPAGFRGAVTQGGQHRTVGSDGAMTITLRGSDAPQKRTTYRVGLGDAASTEPTLQRYERERVGLMRGASTKLDGRTIVGLEVPEAIRLRPFERAWLPVAGHWIGAHPHTSVADSLGKEWPWTSSDRSVADVALTVFRGKSVLRDAGSRYVEVDAGSTAGTGADISTIVGGRRYSVHVSVEGQPVRERGANCEPGNATKGIELVGSRTPDRPLTGTLLQDGSVVWEAVGPGVAFSDVTGDTCTNAQIASISHDELVRYQLATLAESDG